VTAVPALGHRPLAATLERVDALGPYLACGVGVGRGPDAGTWVSPEALCREGGDVLERLLAEVGRRSGTTERRVQAASLLEWYAWYALAPVLGSYLLERRVPLLTHDNVAVWLHPADGPGRLALRSDAFLALEHDPEAGAPGVTVVPDEGALRDALHDGIVAHMAPLVAALRRHSPLGAKAQWLEIADRVGSALQHAGERSGTEQEAIREAEALVHRPGSPLNSPRSRFATYEHCGERRVVKLRGACCLTYRLPARAYCLTCPLVGELERAARIRAWIDEERAAAAS
jgi:ferric iron reductase protein FhuF